MKEVHKIGIGRLAASAVLQVVLEFDKLRFGDLPAGRKRAEFLVVLGMGSFRIQHHWPHGETSGAVHPSQAAPAETSSTPPVPDSNDAARWRATPSCARQFH